jgi:putative PEP-CTERM system TPR-repeat lipoprotein
MRSSPLRTASSSQRVFWLVILFLAGCSRDPATDLAQAEERFAAADYRTAAVLVQSALQGDPGNIGAHLLAGRLGLALGDFAQARLQLETARDAGAPSALYAVPLARTLLELNLAADALATLDEVGAEAAGADYWLVRARALSASGDMIAASRAFEAAERAGGETPALLVERARSAAIRGANDDAEGLLARALAVDEENAEALALRAILAVSSGRLEQAAADMEAAARIFDSRYQTGLAAPVLLGLVQVQLARNDLDAAAATARRLSNAIPNTAFADYANALVAFQRGDFAATVDLLREALTKSPNQPQLMSLLGAAHLAVGNFGQAEQQFLAILNDNPADPAAVRLLAETRIRQQRPRAALEALELFRGTGTEADVGVLLLQSAARMQTGDFAGAIPYLEQARGLDPGSQLVVVRLLQAYVGAGRVEEAAALLGTSSALTLDEAYSASVTVLVAKLQTDGAAAARAYVDERLTANPRDPYARLLEATFHELTNDRPRVEQSLAAALEIDPDFPLARLARAAWLVNDARADEAVAEYQAVLRLAPTNTLALLSLAQLAAQENDLGAAEGFLNRAADGTQAALPLLALARVALAKGDIAAAQRHVDLASRREPGSPDVLLARGMVETASGRAREAAALFREAVQRLPNRPSAALLLADAEAAAGDLRAGRDALATAVAAMPEVTELRAALGAAELRLGNAAAALRIATELQVELGQQPAGYALEAQVRMAERRYGDAARMFDLAYQRRRNIDLLARLVGAAQLAGGGLGEEARLDEWLAASPNDIQGRLLRADWLQGANRVDEALAEYARVIDIDPRNAVALNNAAWYAFLQGRPEALGYARRAAEAAPQSAPVIDTLGWLLTESGRAEEGLPHLVKATELAPESAEIRYHLAVAQARAGQTEAARATLSGLLSSTARFAERAVAERLLESLSAARQ